MRTEDALVIGDLASLDLWRQQVRSLVWSQNLPIVEFQLQEFSTEYNHSLSSRTRRFQKACGCTSGSFFMSITVVALLISYFGSGGQFFNISLLDVLSFVGMSLLAALAGKLLGLFWARWRLLRLASTVNNMIVRAAQRAVTESVQGG